MGDAYSDGRQSQHQRALQNVAQIPPKPAETAKVTEIAESPPGPPRLIKSGMAELIILRPAFRITQHSVRFVDLFEFFLRIRRLIDIGVQLAR